jgi:riboflavin synthase
MFTGIVDDLGTLVARTARGPGARLSIACRYEALALGESIAVSGVCLTVDRATPMSNGRATFEADASSETLARTTLGALENGSIVNLERALLPTSRLGGHLVSGHVDATTTLIQIAPLGEAKELVFALPRELARFVAEKGSIAIDGVSLTVNGAGNDTFDVAIIPHTLSRTSLAKISVGDRVNLEVDLLARYVARQLAFASSAAPSDRERDASLLGALGRAGML